jgi:hypothetical protein
MDANYDRAIGDIEINTQSRATLATLRPSGVSTFPAGPQSALEDLVRNAPGAMALLDESCCHLEVSNAYCVQLGVSRINILGKTFTELCSALPEGLERALSRALAGESVTLENRRVPGADLERTRIAWKLHPWRKTRKRIGGVVLFLHELTKPAPHCNPEDDLLDILERSAGFVAITAADGRISFINANGRQLVGLATMEEARNRRMEEFFWSSTTSQLSSFSPNHPWAGEMLLRNSKTGSSVPMLLTVFAAGNGVGVDAGFAYIGIHLQSQKLEEKTLRAFDEQFRPSMKMESFCRSASVIAHDLNNMLLVINGYSSLLMDDLKSDSPFGAKAASIFHAGERATKLADQLLALSHSRI